LRLRRPRARRPAHHHLPLLTFVSPEPVAPLRRHPWEVRVFGVHTALITPFRPDGEVDHAAFERLVQRQVEAGVHGLVPCGTTGETPTLTEPEQAELVRRTLALAKGLPVSAGVGTNDTRTTVAKVEATQALGVQAGLLVFPYYNKPNPN